MGKRLNTDPFNVKVTVKAEPVTVTILPDEGGLFKVIYFGGILGGIEQSAGKWSRLPEEQVPAGDLPPYRYKEDHGEAPLELDDDLVEAIGKEIATGRA